MIGYLMVGSNDIPKAVAFYDELLALLGAKRIMEKEGMFVSWGTAMDKPGFAVTKPYDGKPATVGNGCMTAFTVDSKEKVHEFYDKAIALGAKDEGPAGPRSDDFYAGYFRDLDGNKLNVFCMT
jgi:catechol 2,3-dioxygenase-like lactoylglutathione lyase family enzyme